MLRPCDIGIIWLQKNVCIDRSTWLEKHTTIWWSHQNPFPSQLNPNSKSASLRARQVMRFSQTAPNALIFYSKNLSLFLNHMQSPYFLGQHLSWPTCPRSIFGMMTFPQAKQRYIPPCPCSHGIALQLHWQVALQRPGLCQSHSATPEDFLYLKATWFRLKGLNIDSLQL